MNCKLQMRQKFVVSALLIKLTTERVVGNIFVIREIICLRSHQAIAENLDFIQRSSS